MSEYELIDAITGSTDLLMTSVSMYVTFTTAYLICAYLAGSNLNRSQYVIITVMYGASAGLATLAILSIGGRILDLYSSLKLTNPDRLGLIHDWIYVEISIIAIVGIFASFKFMWDVRHPKA